MAYLGEQAGSRFGRESSLSPKAGAGWSLETVRPPAALYGANGITIGPDGRLWICEGMGRRITACDVETGVLETMVPTEAGVHPDDLAFGPDGTAYITSANEVVARAPDGTCSVFLPDVTSANGITVDGEGRLYVDEFRMGGRVLEVTLPDPETLRVVAEGVDLPNACQKGRDGRLYLQNVMQGTVFALDVETGEKEQIADGLKRVSAVKITPAGRVAASQSDIGEVTEIDPATGAKALLARMPHNTIDNLCYDDQGALYVSNYATGGVIRVAPGEGPHGTTLVPHGLVSPLTLAPFGGGLLVANLVTVVHVAADGEFEVWSPWSPLSMETTAQAAWPVDADTAYVMTGGGQVLRTRRGQSVSEVLAAAEVAAEGATAITGRDGQLLIAMAGEGEIRTIAGDGELLESVCTGQSRIDALAATADLLAAADTAAGTVVVIADGAQETLTGFDRPTGVAIVDGSVFVVEHALRRLVRCGLDGGDRQTVVDGLPLGSATEERPSYGAASLLAQDDGSILIGCDGDGSILRLSQT